MNVEEKVIKKIESLAKKKVTNETKIADLNLDSLDLAELIFDLESEMKTTIDDERLQRIITIQDAIDLFK